MVHYENKHAYDILIRPDFSELPEAIKAFGLTGRRLMIITDSNVSKNYLKEIIDYLSPLANQVASFVFPAGESSKNLTTVSQCYEQLINLGFDRNDILIALGGGVVGDLTGFVAATYLRGIRFIQLPTSLLSMVDSSIGGKTGVDFNAYKNMIGAFHQPKLVYMNLSTLNSLRVSEFNSGMGEVIKHGLIKDLSYYQWLKEKALPIKEKQYDVLSEMIYRSCRIKQEVVEADPKEQGERALLNFGHTIGHSIEKLKDFALLHGECVSIGMVAAAYLSLKRGLISETEYKDIRNTLKAFQQPINTKHLEVMEVLKATKLDKKMDSGRIKFILLNKIGEAYIDLSITEEEMTEAIKIVVNEE